MRGSDKRMHTSDGSDEESDPRMGLMARPQKKSPDKGMNVLERAEIALRRSTRNRVDPAQNFADDFEYPHRKPKSKATQRTENLEVPLWVNELQGTQASAGNSEREEPSTLIETSAKTAKNLGKSKAIGRKDAISPSPQGRAAKPDVALPPRAAPKGRREALESQKQLVTKIKGGSKNKPVKMPAKPGGPPSSPSSSSSDDDLPSRSRSRGGYDDSDNSEDEEEEPEDNDSDDARSSGDESPPEDPPDDPSDPNDSSDSSDTESDDDSRDGVNATRIKEKKSRVARESIQTLKKLLTVVEKYNRSRDKKKTLLADDCLDKLNMVGGNILGEKLTLSKSEKRSLRALGDGVNSPWTSWYQRHLKKCETISELLMELIDLLVLVGAVQTSRNAVGERSADCNVQALLPIAGAVFDQLNIYLTREGVHDEAWETSNKAWLRVLQNRMEMAAKTSTPSRSNFKDLSKKGFNKYTDLKAMDTIKRNIITILQGALKQVYGIKLSCAGFAIKARTIIHDYDSQIRRVVSQDDYEETRIDIVRRVLLYLDPNECDSDVIAITKHMSEHGKVQPLNNEVEPQTFETWIEWIRSQSSKSTLRLAVIYAMDAIYSAPGLGSDVHQAHSNLEVHLRTIEGAYRRLDFHPLSKTGVLREMSDEMESSTRKVAVLSSYVEMARAILTSIEKQYSNKIQPRIDIWIHSFQREIDNDAADAAKIRNTTGGGRNTEKNSKFARFAKFYAAINKDQGYDAMQKNYKQGLISEVIGPAIWKAVRQSLIEMKPRVALAAKVHHVTGHLDNTHLDEEENVTVEEEEEAAVMMLGESDFDPEVNWDDLEHFVHNISVGTQGSACFGCNQPGHALSNCPLFKPRLEQLKSSANALVKEMVKGNTEVEGPAFSALITDLKYSNTAYQEFIRSNKSSYPKKRPPPYPQRRNFTPRQ